MGGATDEKIWNVARTMSRTHSCTTAEAFGALTATMETYNHIEWESVVETINSNVESAEDEFIEPPPWWTADDCQESRKQNHSVIHVCIRSSVRNIKGLTTPYRFVWQTRRNLLTMLPAKPNILMGGAAF